MSRYMLQDCRKCTGVLNPEVHGQYEAASMATSDSLFGHSMRMRALQALHSLILDLPNNY